MGIGQWHSLHSKSSEATKDSGLQIKNSLFTFFLHRHKKSFILHF